MDLKEVEISKNAEAEACLAKENVTHDNGGVVLEKEEECKLQDEDELALLSHQQKEEVDVASTMVRINPPKSHICDDFKNSSSMLQTANHHTQRSVQLPSATNRNFWPLHQRFRVLSCRTVCPSPFFIVSSYLRGVDPSP